MALISDISASLTCPHGHSTEGVNIRAVTTLLGHQPSGIFHPTLEIGHTYPGLDVSDFDDTYSRLRWPSPGEPIRVLEAWWCPTCEAKGLGSRHWAVVVFEGESFVSMDTIELTISCLRTVHFLGEDVVDLFEWKLGSEVLNAFRIGWQHLDPKVLDHLAPHLPA